MAVFIASVVSVVVVMLITAGIGEWTCSSMSDKMGFKSDYGFVQGCMIKVDSRWIPLESYRTLND
jgi:hypothetical protein